MGEFRMPSLGADMDYGTVVEWRVAPGDTVHHGDIVAVIDTEKSTIEVEVFEDGVIEELLVPAGEEVAVGTPLARIGGGGLHSEGPGSSSAEPSLGPVPSPGGGRTSSPVVRHLADEAHVDLASLTGTGPGGAVTRADVERAVAARTEVGPPPAPAPAPPAPAAPAPAPKAPPAPAGPGSRHRASPRARRLAAERGVDLAQLTGTGPRGAVVAADLEAGAAPPATTPGAGSASTTPGTPAGDRKAKLRRSLATLMARSKREIPHYYLSTTIDLGPASAWMAGQNAARPIQRRLVPAALLARATVLAASTVPEMNGHFVDGRFVPSETVDLGIAVSLRGGGLVAPAIRGAEELDLDALMDRLRDLVTRARVGTLRSSEMTDPSITVTNLGDQGVEAVYGVIYPPQVALVGFGRVAERPAAVDGMLTVRPVVTATLSADHRVSDGHDGARFLGLVDQHLQHPELL